MNELIKVNYENADRPTVMGRELHEALKIETPYKKWFDRMCEYGFTENEDYSVMDIFVPNSNGGRQSHTDHQLTIDMAKEICMIQRSDMGRKCRKYFIEVEKKYRDGIGLQKPDSYTIEDPAARARRWAEEYEEKKALEIKNIELIEQNDKLVTENKYMKPKAAYFDALVDRETLTNFRDTAQELNIPQVAFINFLKDNNYIYFKGSGKNRQIRAYAEPVKDGLFTLKEFTNKHNGFKGVQVFVTPKGRNVFGKLLGAIERYIDD